jgi:hypothetical protein
MRFAALFSLTLAATAAAQTPPAQLIGRVIDHKDGDAISGAAVKLSNGANVVTDKRGWFTFTNVPEGRFEVAVEMIGYQSRTDSITIQGGRTHDMQVRLSTKPVELPPLAVTVRSQWLEENGFYTRQREGGLSPRIVTAADLERRGRSTMTEVFAEIPSLRVVTLGTGNSSVRRVVRFMNEDSKSRYTKIPGCEPALYIDGMRHRDRLLPTAGTTDITIDTWDILAPIAIEAIEIYRGGGAPMMYNDNCGTILIWTKRGR